MVSCLSILADVAAAVVATVVVKDTTEVKTVVKIGAAFNTIISNPSNTGSRHKRGLSNERLPESSSTTLGGSRRCDFIK